MKSPTYDEIIRRTVPEPDSSFRPLVRTDSPDSETLRSRVVDALQSRGYFDVGYEIEGACVILRGQTPDLAMRDRIERLVAAVDGVERVDCRIQLT